MLITATNSSLYAQDGALSYYSSTNGVYLNGAGTNGWLRLNGSGTENYQNCIDIYGSASSYILFRTSNNSRMIINSSGDIGMGTTSPVARVQIGGNTFSGGNGVYNNARVGMMLNGSLTSYVYASTYNDSTYPDYGLVFIHGANTTSYNVWSISPDGPAKGSGLHLLYGSNATNIHTVTPKVSFIGSSGNVGVGTSSPSVRLQVVGDNSTEGQLYVGNTDVTYSAGINFTTSGTNRGFVGWRHTNSGSPYSLTGIHLFNTDNSNIVFGTNGAVRAVINLNGNLGVGTTTPSYRLEVVTGGALAQRLQSSNSTVGNPIIDIYDSGRAQETVISSTDGTTTGTYIASYSNHPLLFGTNAGSAPTAKVRIEADQVSSPISTMKIGPGGILWGGNNSGKEINSCQISAGYHQSNSMNFVGMSSTTSSADRRMDFWVEGGAFFRGTLTATGDIVAYGSTSDIRLKKNIVPIRGAIDALIKVNGYTFQWNERAPVEKRDKTEYGVIAQEVEAAGLDLLIRDYVRPVNGTGGDDTPPEVWKSVQYEKFVPILIEAIKEQQIQIEGQKTQNQSLLARIEALESQLLNRGI
jgi:hypothetical protein